jgi:hypothetical protein
MTFPGFVSSVGVVETAGKLLKVLIIVRSIDKIGLMVRSPLSLAVQSVKRRKIA